MNQLAGRIINARTQPNPLPRGEGTATTRFDNFGSPSGKSSRGFFEEAANDSPSPGGEGRGEGGRHN